MIVADRQPTTLVRADVERALAFLGALPWPIGYAQGPAQALVFTNGAWDALPGLAGHPTLDAALALLGPTAVQAAQRAFASGDITSARELALADPAAPGWMHATFVPVRGALGDLDGLLALLTPVTGEVAARKRAEEALAAVEMAAERMRLAVASAEIGTFDWDVVAGRLDADPRCFEIFGLPPGATLDHAGFAALVHPDDRAAVREAITAALAPDGDRHYEKDYRVVLPGGGVRWVGARGRAFFYKGAPLRLLGTLVDLTDRHETQQRFADMASAADLARADARCAQRRLELLAEAGELLASSLEWDVTLDNVMALAMPALADFGFFDVVESGGSVRRVSRAHEDPRRAAILAPSSWVRSERTDMNLCALSTGESGWHPDIGDAWLEAVAVSPEHLALMRELAFCSMITVPLRHRGRLLGALTLFFADSGRHHTAEDLQLAEELARRAAVALENARLLREARDALAQREDFLVVASHELRTPLATLRLGADAMMRQARSDGLGALEPRIGNLQKQLRRLESLVSDLLDVEQMGRGQFALDLRPVDLSAVVRDVAGQLTDARAAAECPLTLTLAEGLVGRWDQGRLEQVVTNLLGNALKYGRGRPIDIVTSRQGDRARLVVRDHGIGLTAEHAERIFGLFERAVSTRHYGGFGLGLWICRQILDQLGGTIRAEGEPGHGATFTVELPLSGVSGEPPAETRPAS